MSIRDYKQNYVIINGVTNEQIKIPRSNVNSTVTLPLTIDEAILVETLFAELVDSDSITIFKSYMKD